MTESGGKQLREPDSFWHRRHPGIRYIYSAAAIIGGIILAVRWSSRLGDSAGSTWLFIGALALIVLGLASIPIYRWMDKRRL